MEKAGATKKNLLNCNKNFTTGLPKNLKDFANNRQVKHSSTVLEPSIPFHTLIKLVDCEDIANDKIRTHDLTLEVHNITKQLQTRTLDSSQQEQVMFTRPRDPNNAHEPYKNCASIVIEQIISSPLVSKSNGMMKTKEMLMLDQNLLKNLLYNTFVPPQTTEQNDMIHDIKVDVHHGILIIPKTTIHKIDIALHLEIDLVMTKLLLLNNTLDHDMTIINETRDLIAPRIDPFIVHLIDVTPATVRDHAHIHEITTILQDTHLPLDHLHDQEILDFLDLAQTQIQETNLIQYKQKVNKIQLTLKYICITQPK